MSASFHIVNRVLKHIGRTGVISERNIHKRAGIFATQLSALTIVRFIVARQLYLSELWLRGDDVLQNIIVRIQIF